METTFIIFILLTFAIGFIGCVLVYILIRIKNTSEIVRENARIANHNEALQKHVFNETVKTVNKNFEDIDDAVKLITDRIQKLEKDIEEAIQYSQTHKAK